MGILCFFLNAFGPIYIHIYLAAPRALSRGVRIKAAARKVEACNLSARSGGGGEGGGERGAGHGKVCDIHADRY